MSTLLITGGNGLLGFKLIQQAAAAGHQVAAMSRQAPAYRDGSISGWHQVDLRYAAAVPRHIHQVRPDAIVHTAAMTNVDACELHPEEAWETNVTATDHVVRAAREVGAYLVLLSSDYVFSGEEGPYSEADLPGPAGSVYGRTKLEAESLVLGQCPDAAVARTSLLYGHAPHARPNFVTWLVENLRLGREAAVVTDQTGSPTLADNLAEMVLAMVSRRATGVYHAVGPEWISRLEYAIRIARSFGLDPRLLKPALSAELKQPAPRPRHSGLIGDRVLSDLGVKPVGIDEGLALVRQAMARVTPQ